MSASSVSVNAGASGTITLTVTPQNGFKQGVTFACSGLPTGANCSFKPSLVTPANGPAMTTLTIQAPSTVAAATNETERKMPDSMNAFLGAAERLARTPADSRMAAFCVLAMAIFGIFGILKDSPGRQFQPELLKFSQVLAVSTLLAATLIISGCAGLSGSQAQPQPQSTPANYTVTVTASGTNSPTHSQSFTLTVMP
jgi:hypothetical protein